MHITNIKKNIVPLIFALSIFSCASKGPKTYSSHYVGKTAAQLVGAKGSPDAIRNFENSKAFIYITHEAYFGKNEKKVTENTKPKRTIQTEYIFYINTTTKKVYKFQVWNKKMK